MESVIKICLNDLNYNYIWIEIIDLAWCIAFAKSIMIYPRLVPFYLLLEHVLIILLSTLLLSSKNYHSVIILCLILSIYVVKFSQETHFFTWFLSIYTELLLTHFPKDEAINICEENVKKIVKGNLSKDFMLLTLAVKSSCLVSKLIVWLWAPLWGLL